MYRSIGPDPALLEGVLNGDMKVAKDALKDGANVNGNPRLPIPPLSAAAAMNEVGMVKLMIERKADPDCPANRDVASPSTDIAVNICEGDRPLHVAAKLGRLEVVRLLLHWAGANPNTTNKPGRTPLMAAVACIDNRVEVVRSLLEAGADAMLEDKNGYTPLHFVGYYGRIDLVDMLHAKAPDTLSRVAYEGETPLCIACAQGREDVVKRMLSLGATHRLFPNPNDGACALSMAAMKGREGIVRILLCAGLRVVGGRKAVMPNAMYTAVRSRHARVLRMLIESRGKKTPKEWANTSILGRRMLHYATGYCYLAAVSVLLAAGADETAQDFAELTPIECIGIEPGPKANISLTPIVRGEELAIRRMLLRGPAYRALSWAWPAAKADPAWGNGGGGNRDTRGGASSPASGVPKTPKGPKPPTIMKSTKATKATKDPSIPVGMKIFRPDEKSSSSRKFFVGAVGR